MELLITPNDSGSGTTNTIAKWTAPSVLGNSSITDDGTIVTSSVNVSIPSGTLAAPSLQLGASTQGLYSDATGKVDVVCNAGFSNFLAARFDSNGNFLVGTTTSGYAVEIGDSNGSPGIRVKSASQNVGFLVDGGHNSFAGFQFFTQGTEYWRLALGLAGAQNATDWGMLDVVTSVFPWTIQRTTDFIGINNINPGYRLDVADATTNGRGLNISQTSASAGTAYGLYSTATGAATTNVGGYFTASGATNNYPIIVPNGNISCGIGITAPIGVLHVAATVVSGNRGIYLDQNTDDTAASLMLGRKSRGTQGSPTAVKNGDTIFNFAAQGYNGSSYGNASAQQTITTQDWTTSAQGAQLRLSTCPNGSTANTQHAVLDNNGNFAVSFNAAVSNPTYCLEAQGGDIAAITAGKGFRVKEGSNAKMGTATLAAGTVVVSTTAVTANSRIFLTSNADGGTAVGGVRVSARTAGTSFTITADNALDTSTIAWIIFEPS